MVQKQTFLICQYDPPKKMYSGKKKKDWAAQRA